MRRDKILIVLSSLILYAAAVGSEEPSCVAPRLTDSEVKALVDKERATRKDLPAPFPRSRWLVRRQGCHYTFIEYGLPEAPDYNNIIRLNQHGVVVDAQTGNPLPSATGGGAHGESGIKCPGTGLSEEELAQIVKNARSTRHDLPPPFPEYKTRVDRLRCLYLYFEYSLPERRGDYQVFTIDPLGELLEFSRSQPY